MKKQRIDVAFLFLTALFYVGFMLIDWLGLGKPLLSNLLKFSIVCFCVAYLWIVSTERFLQLALMFTLAADVFLLWGQTYWQHALGMFLFCFAQLFHGLRLGPDRLRTMAWFCIFASVGLVCFALANMFLSSQAILIAFGACYALQLLRNCFLACRMLVKKTEAAPIPFFACLGMLLFLFCDINVFLHNAGSVFGFSASAAGLIANLMWTFYAPAQYFLVRSAKNIRKGLAFGDGT